MTGPPSESGFRWLLAVGAVVSVAVAMFGMVWPPVLESALGLRGASDAATLSRLFGGAMLAVGVGYALAAANPQRSRGLLVPLFVAPLATALAMIAGLASDEVAGQGIGFVIYNLAFSLLYFRLYPRVRTEPAAGEPIEPAEPPQPG